MARCARHAGCGHGSCGYSGFTCSRGGNPPAMCGSPEGHVHPASPVTRAVALDSPLPGRGGRAEDAKQNRRSVVMPAVSSRHCHPFRRRRCLLPVPPAAGPSVPVPPPPADPPLPVPSPVHTTETLPAAAAAAAACYLYPVRVRPCPCCCRLLVPCCRCRSPSAAAAAADAQTKTEKKDGDPGRVVAARRCCCVAPKSLSVRGLITLGAVVCRTV